MKNILMLIVCALAPALAFAEPLTCESPPAEAAARSVVEVTLYQGQSVAWSGTGTFVGPMTVVVATDEDGVPPNDLVQVGWSEGFGKPLVNRVRLGAGHFERSEARTDGYTVLIELPAMFETLSAVKERSLSIEPAEPLFVVGYHDGSMRYHRLPDGSSDHTSGDRVSPDTSSGLHQLAGGAVLDCAGRFVELFSSDPDREAALAVRRSVSANES